MQQGNNNDFDNVQTNSHGAAIQENPKIIIITKTIQVRFVGHSLSLMDNITIEWPAH